MRDGAGRKVLGAVVVVALAVAVALVGPSRALEALGQLKGMGPLGALLYALGYAVGCVLFLPGTPLSLGGGALFGPLWGFVAVWGGATLGAVLAFVLGRTLLRDAISARVGERPGWRAVDAAISRRGFRVVFLLRLSPLFPFNVLNYGLGLTSVTLGQYALATALGIIPGCAVIVSVGHTAGELARIVGGHRAPRTPAQDALLIVGVVATVLVTAAITRAARRELAAITAGEAVSDEASTAA